LFDLRNLCYYLEGNGTDLPFKVAGRIQAFKEMYPNGQMKTLPATNALVMQAIAWSTEDGSFKILLSLIIWHQSIAGLLRLMWPPSIHLEGQLPLMLYVLQP
jgi:hypothetical protein